MQSIPNLADELQEAAGAARPLRICVVTSEIIGPVRNGGIGAATTGLVEHLARDGHEVTVLYTLVEYGVPACDDKTWPFWVDAMARRGIELAHIPHDGNYRTWRRKSWLVKEFLAERDFEVVYFNEHHGSGYYALAAKRAGLAPFAQRIHCVIAHGSIEWVFNTNDQLMRRPSDLEMIGLERRSVEWADAVIGPSEYLLREYQSYGWRLPARTYTQPYPLPLAGVARDPAVMPINEFVFFGRLETRKGLWLVCEALDRLGERLRGRTVTFMGRMVEIGGIPSAAFIIERAARWPFRIRLLTRLGQTEALSYLRHPGRLALMPSLADNSPCVIYECMENRIPFVAASGSGADELVHPDCWDRVMVEPSVDALCQALERVLDEGAGLAWPRFDAQANLQAWSAWGRWLGAHLSGLDAQGPADADVVPRSAPGLLLVTLDGDGCSLALLHDHLTTHFRRFGPSVRHLVLTSRDGPAKELVAGVLAEPAAEAGVDVTILGSDSIELARDAMLGADFAFFADAEHELLAPFVAAAVGVLARRGAAAVSCVVAERQGPDGRPGIVELPCGDLPGAGGLGLPIGSGVWGASTGELADEFAGMALYRSETGEFVSAAALCQAVLHKAMLADKGVMILPSVGAIRTHDLDTPRRRRHWYDEALESARSVGITPRVHPNAAPWLGILAAHGAGAGKPERINGLAGLPRHHPLHAARQTGHDLADLAILSAAMGRPDQAAQIEAATGKAGESLGVILDVAERAASARPVIDLRGAIGASEVRRLGPARNGRSLEVARAGLRERLAAAIRDKQTPSARPGVARPALDGDGERDLSGSAHDASRDGEGPAAVSASFRVHSDNFRLRRSGDVVEMESEDHADPGLGRLLLTDVPLAGHLRLSADLLLRSPAAASVRLIILDQTRGGEMGRVEARAEPGAVARLAVALHGVYGLACIDLEVGAEAEPMGGPLVVRLNRLEIA